MNVNNVKCHISNKDSIPLLPILKAYDKNKVKTIKSKISCSASPNHIIPIEISGDTIDLDSEIMNYINDMDEEYNDEIGILKGDDDFSEEYSYLVNSFILDDPISACIHLRVMLDRFMWNIIFKKIFKDEEEKEDGLKKWSTFFKLVKCARINGSIQGHCKDCKGSIKKEYHAQLEEILNQETIFSKYARSNKDPSFEDIIVKSYKEFSQTVHRKTPGEKTKNKSVKDIFNTDLKDFFTIVKECYKEEGKL